MPRHKLRATLVMCLLGAILLGMTIGAMLAFAVADDGDVPGAVSKPMPILTTGTVDANTDARDVYSFTLKKGATIEASMTGAPGTNFDLWVFAPGTTSVVNNKNWNGHSSNPGTSTEDFTMVAYVAGTYYVDVRATSGSGAYQLNVHNIGAVPFAMAGVSAPKSAKKGKFVRVATSLTPAYNNDFYTPIKFYFYRWESHRWKLKGWKWGLGWQDVGRSKSLVWSNYKFTKKGSWRMRAQFWDPAHAAGMKSGFRKITIR